MVTMTTYNQNTGNNNRQYFSYLAGKKHSCPLKCIAKCGRSFRKRIEKFEMLSTLKIRQYPGLCTKIQRFYLLYTYTLKLNILKICLCKHKTLVDILFSSKCGEIV